jgi:hypothetical protein
VAIGPFTAMVSITITPAAHQAIKASLLGTADATPRPGPDGLIRIWLDRKFVDRLDQMRGPGESYSDVILRLAGETRQSAPDIGRGG